MTRRTTELSEPRDGILTVGAAFWPRFGFAPGRSLLRCSKRREHFAPAWIGTVKHAIARGVDGIGPARRERDSFRTQVLQGRDVRLQVGVARKARSRLGFGQYLLHLRATQCRSHRNAAQRNSIDFLPREEAKALPQRREL